MVSLRRIGISATILFALVANAATTGFTGTLKNIRNGYGAEGFYFDMDGAASNKCQFTSSFIIQGPVASPAEPNPRKDLDEMVALVMLAYSTGKTVGVVTDSTCVNGAGNVVGINLP